MSVGDAKRAKPFERLESKKKLREQMLTAELTSEKMENEKLAKLFKEQSELTDVLTDENKELRRRLKDGDEEQASRMRLLQKQVTTQSGTIQALKLQNDQLSGHFERLRSAYHERFGNKSLEEELQEARMQSESSLAELQARASMFDQARTILEEELKQANEEIVCLREQKVRTRMAERECRDEIQNLERALGNATYARQMLEATLSQTVEEFMQKQDEWAAQVSALTNQKEELKNEVERSFTLSEKLQEAECSLVVLQKAAAARKSERDDLRFERDNLQELNDELYAELRNAKAEQNEKEEELRKANEAILLLQDQEMRAKIAERECRDEVQNLERELGTATYAKQMLEATLSQTVEEFMEKKDEWAAQVSALTNQKEEELGAATYAKQMLQATLSQTVEEFMEKKDEWAAQVSALTNQKEEASKQLTIAQRHEEEKVEEIALLRDRLNATLTLRENDQEAIALLKEQLKLSSSEVEAMQQRFDELNERHQHLLASAVEENERASTSTLDENERSLHEKAKKCAGHYASSDEIYEEMPKQDDNNSSFDALEVDELDDKLASQDDDSGSGVDDSGEHRDEILALEAFFAECSDEEFWEHTMQYMTAAYGFNAELDFYIQEEGFEEAARLCNEYKLPNFLENRLYAFGEKESLRGTVDEQPEDLEAHERYKIEQHDEAFEEGTNFSSLDVQQTEKSHGGFGRVYKLKTADPRVVKIFDAPSASSAPKYQEGRILLRLSDCEYTPDVYAFGEVPDSDHLYVVMEAFESDFGELKNPSKEVVKYFGSSAFEALQSLEEFQFVHGDFKPDNVMFDRDGSVKLVDFGSSRPPFTFSNEGKVSYQPPEEFSCGTFLTGNETDYQKLGLSIVSMAFDSDDRCPILRGGVLDEMASLEQNKKLWSEAWEATEARLRERQGWRFTKKELDELRYVIVDLDTETFKANGGSGSLAELSIFQTDMTATEFLVEIQASA